MVKVGRHIEEARSMRDLLGDLHAEAQKCTEDGVDDEEMCIVLIIDFCQNMEMPSFNGTQPGETYYYSPMTVPTLGIVDGNTKENILYAYIYSEAEGNKGGNVVASLIMKYLSDRGLLDGKKRAKLTIVMDNCPGQNKNNHVVRLAPYLVAKGYFKKAGFLFLLAGHTKNWADKRFNNLKEDYRVTDLFCMDDLVAACNRSDYVIAEQVYWKDFRNYNHYLDSFFKKMEAVKIYQMFNSSFDYAATASVNIGLGNMKYRTYLKKQIRGGAAARTALMNNEAGYLYAFRPGLKDIKKVELFCKYRSLSLIPKRCRNITCPDPGQEVIDNVKKTRAQNNTVKRAAKKLKEGDTTAKKGAKKKGAKKTAQEKSNNGNKDDSDIDCETTETTTKRKANQLNSDDEDEGGNNIGSPVNFDSQPQYFGNAW
ncbi:hypothetical protein FRACYDRAFT_258320 [Fragilariopsis cylindrus CCMP1102]|uniref:DUF7869 domain-containing protein n=1 Tax=Fragilariopsis cylindrus CCMP1102 TaxID=635003 RepID=A0A1E7EIQ4_9STRA|nr:hypothetical protein FRACYDRAFT_258320 [Fragilariopsis cylindrus CCMP1102]|eukprot:OEU05772.1 hypothetical protein FRACYDRAFT_258320 [Fragilariopsis cylindrus CCMP1102]